MDEEHTASMQQWMDRVISYHVQSVKQRQAKSWIPALYTHDTKLTSVFVLTSLSLLDLEKQASLLVRRVLPHVLATPETSASSTSQSYGTDVQDLPFSLQEQMRSQYSAMATYTQKTLISLYPDISERTTAPVLRLLRFVCLRRLLPPRAVGDPEQEDVYALWKESPVYVAVYPCTPVGHERLCSDRSNPELIRRCISLLAAMTEAAMSGGTPAVTASDVRQANLNLNMQDVVCKTLPDDVQERTIDARTMGKERESGSKDTAKQAARKAAGMILSEEDEDNDDHQVQDRYREEEQEEEKEEEEEEEEEEEQGEEQGEEQEEDGDQASSVDESLGEVTIPTEEAIAENITQRADQSVSDMTSVSAKLPCVDRSLVSLKPHQLRVVRYLADDKHRGLIVAFAVGTGKTLTAVAASQCVLDKHRGWKVVVVAPKSLKTNFGKEMVKYGADPNDPRYIYMTHDGFYRNLNKFMTETDPALGKDQYSLNTLCGNKTFLIVDEAHNFRTEIRGSKGGKRSNAAVQCAIDCAKVMLLTATPVYNAETDILNLAAMVRGEDALTPSQARSLSDAELRGYFKCTISYKDQDKDISKYPTFEEHTVFIPMAPDFYEKYRKYEDRQIKLYEAENEMRLRKRRRTSRRQSAGNAIFYDEEQDKDFNPFVFLSGVRQATNAFDPCQKCDWVMNLITEHPDQRVVVYSQYLEHGIERIANMLRARNIPYGMITGETKETKTSPERSNIVKGYNSGAFNVLLITAAGGEGLDLKKTRYIVHLERGWNKAKEDQVNGRGIRYESHIDVPDPRDRHVDVYYLVLQKPQELHPEDTRPQSADERLHDLILAKHERLKAFDDMLRQGAIENVADCSGPTFSSVMTIEKWIQHIREFVDPQRRGPGLYVFEFTNEDKRLLDFLHGILNTQRERKLQDQEVMDALVYLARGEGLRIVDELGMRAWVQDKHGLTSLLTMRDKVAGNLISDWIVQIVDPRNMKRIETLLQTYSQ